MLCFKFEQNCTINIQFDFFEGREGWREEMGTPFLNLNLNYYWYTYELLFFSPSKFQQNRTINEEYGFFEWGERGGQGRPQYLNFILNYYWYTYAIVGIKISAKLHHKY